MPASMISPPRAWIPAFRAPSKGWVPEGLCVGLAISFPIQQGICLPCIPTNNQTRDIVGIDFFGFHDLGYHIVRSLCIDQLCSILFPLLNQHFTIRFHNLDSVILMCILRRQSSATAGRQNTTAGLCEAVIMTPIALLVAPARKVAKSPTRNTTCKRSSALGAQGMSICSHAASRAHTLCGIQRCHS